jgi:hypothetical protein
MRVRRHLAAAVLFGVQLLQGILPAAGASCERPMAQVAVSVAEGAGAAAATHHAATTHYHHAQPSAPASAPAEQPHDVAVCPMAMACAAVGVASSAVVVSTVDVAIDVHRPVRAADWPVSFDLAPEPPPPRG